MRIVTNPGANLSAAEVTRYGLELLSQTIMVDGVPHDTRGSTRHAEVDAWVRSAKDHPHLLGSSAAEFIDLFRRLAASDREILVIINSKKLIGTYNSAISALRTFSQLSQFAGVRCHVLDSGVTDLGTGLVVLYAAEASKAGLPFDRVVSATERFARGAQLVFAPHDLDYVIKGGRVSFLKSMVANLLGLSPILAMEEGEVRSVGTCKRDEIAAAASRTLVQRVGKKRRVWLGVVHGGGEAGARDLSRSLGTELDAQLSIVRPLSASLYLHAGPRSLAMVACPLDDLEWDPPSSTIIS